MIHIALAGNPNSGKTQTFNALTGATAHVGNWPGVTVDKREGTYKKTPEPISIVDLPGVYSLSPYTPEEVISRNYIVDERPDCIVNIVDSTNLERNLYLTTQLLEIDVPVVIALNMTDVLDKEGSVIDPAVLEKKLNVPVVRISALKGTGLDVLMNTVYQASKKERKGFTVLSGSAISHLVGDAKIAFEAKGVYDPLFHAVKLTEGDELEVAAHPDEVNIVNKFKATFSNETFGSDLEALVANERYQYISNYLSCAITRKQKVGAADKMTVSDKVDKVLTHRVFGPIIFLVILFAVFHLTFSEDLFFLGGLISDDWTSLSGTFFEGLFGSGAINSPGVILFTFFDCIFSGITGGISGGLESAAAPELVSGLLCDGVLSGIFAVLGFLPQILLLFMFFSILEDSGYMARVAFMLDRVFRKFGLSGRAFMPMIMGFGCALPAMINTRTLADEKERTATIRVIPFFSCGAKLPILTAIAGGIVQMFGVGNADVITFLMYVIGIALAIISVIIMRATTMKGATPPFIMELPAYHRPGFKNLMLHLWDKTKHFVKKAFTIIFASTVIIYLLSHLAPAPIDGSMFVGDEQMNSSILGLLGQSIQIIFTPLGFGSQLGAYGWVFAVAAITGLIAKENVIATFAVLAGCLMSIAPDVLVNTLPADTYAELMAVLAEGGSEEGIIEAVAMIAATGATIPGMISFITFNMTTIPCFAACATAKAELPKGKFKWTLLFWLTASYILSMVIYLVGEFVWTLAIILPLIAIAILLIVLYNKGKIFKNPPKKTIKQTPNCGGGCSGCNGSCGL